MPDYDTSIKPPGAITEMEISAKISSGTIAKAKAKWLIDTGADNSCVPLAIIEELAAKFGGAGLPYETVQVEDYCGRRSPTKQYSLITEPGNIGNGQEFSFIVLDDSMGLLGRDILNQRLLTLDGPNGRWDFQ